jgi:hypothetical protein
MAIASINLDKPDGGNNSQVLVVIFFTLQCIGFIGTSLILATALLARKSVKRDWTWINFTISWVLSSLTYILLLITGQQYQKTPMFGICTTQAALVYASPVLTALTALALALQLLYRVRWALGTSSKGEGLSRVKQRYFLIIPWVAFTIVLIEAFIVAGVFPQDIAVESGMYCGVTNGIPGRVTATVVVLTMAMLLGVEIGALKQIYPVWSSFDGRVETSGSSSPRFMILRLGIFSLFAFITVIAGFTFISQVNAAQDTANIFLGILPVAFCVIFGFQKDMLNVWAFWRKVPPAPPLKDFVVISPAAEYPKSSMV